MFRLLGILLGSAISVAVLILLVGIPQISSEQEPEPVTVQLPLATAPLVPPDAPPSSAAEATTEVTTAPLPDVVEEPLEDAAAIPFPEQPRPQEPAESPAASDIRWYAFWSPFRSQIAANGFVAQLQRVTGLDYRVVSVKPGVYEVAFAYNDDDEIPANLSQIATATGLDMPES